MFLFLIGLSFLSLNLHAGQHGPMDPPIIPQQLLQNRRAPDRTAQATLRALIAQYEHQRILDPNNAAAITLLDARIQLIQKDLARLEHAANDFTKVVITSKIVNILSGVIFAGTCYLYICARNRTTTNDPSAR